MFGLAGVSYVYLCYGVHEMFNVVTGREGDGQAVLIRALAVDGQPSTAGRGPGKLTRALGLDRGHNAIDLTSNRELFLAPGRRVGEDQVASSPRIGVAYAGDWANRPLRFYIADHPSVSGRR
jgi:DNA-3-methyladenine glycosylase